MDDAELEGLYRLAHAFVYPSLHEGFGMPVLEAMRRGVPTACADATSLPEVAGDAALLFDPSVGRRRSRSRLRGCSWTPGCARAAERGRDRARRSDSRGRRRRDGTWASYGRAVGAWP